MSPNIYRYGFPHKDLRKIFGDGLITEQMLVAEILRGENTLRFYSEPLAKKLASIVGGFTRTINYGKLTEVIL